MEEGTVGSPVKKQKLEAGDRANRFTPQQIQSSINSMRQKGKLITVQRNGVLYEKSLYVTTGPNKHGQVDCGSVGIEGKVLVHHIYWRYKNEYKSLPKDLPISHLDAEPEVLNLLAESVQMNESRKYCHLFGWYKAQPDEDRPRCPHWENPCAGPP